MTRFLTLILAVGLLVSPAFAVSYQPIDGLADDSITDAKIDWGSGVGQIDATDMLLDTGGSYGGLATNVQDALEELEGASGAPDQNLFSSISDGVNSADADAVTDTVTFQSSASEIDIVASDVGDTVDFSLAVDSVGSEHIIDNAVDTPAIADNAVGEAELDWGSGANQVDATSIGLDSGGFYGGFATNVQDALEELEAADSAFMVDLSGYEVDYDQFTSIGSATETLTNVPVWLPFYVKINNVEQKYGVDYTVTKATKTIDFTVGGAPSSGDLIQVMYLYKL